MNPRYEWVGTVHRGAGSAYYDSIHQYRNLVPPEGGTGPRPMQAAYWQQVRCVVAGSWAGHFSIASALLEMWAEVYFPGIWRTPESEPEITTGDAIDAPYDAFCDCERCLLRIAGAVPVGETSGYPTTMWYLLPTPLDGSEPYRMTSMDLNREILAFQDFIAARRLTRDRARRRFRAAEQREREEAARREREAIRAERLAAGWVQCYHCAELREPENFIDPDTLCGFTQPVCVNCLNAVRASQPCEECGRDINRHMAIRSVEGEYYGPDCAEERLSFCEAGDHWYRPDMWDGDGPHCVDRRELIHNYSYTPRPLVFKAIEADGTAPLYGELDRRRYLGLELEIQWPSHMEISAAQKAYARAGENLIYLKEDGSVDGWEMVTHPMSYRWAMDNFPWSMLSELDEMGGETTKGTGIHVHVSKAAFVRPSHDYRWLMFWHRNQDPLLKIARRRSNDWAAFNPDDRKSLLAIAKKDPNMRYLGRYRAINTSPDNTYEVRVFKASLDPVQVQAALGLVDATVEYARHLDAQKVIKGAGWEWATFARWVKAQGDLYAPLYSEMTRLEIA